MDLFFFVKHVEVIWILNNFSRKKIFLKKRNFLFLTLIGNISPVTKSANKQIEVCRVIK